MSLRPLSIVLLASVSFAASKAFPRFSASSGMCGANPNCVSTLDQRQGRHMEAWRYYDTRAEALARLEKMLRHTLGVTIYPGGVDYVHAEFKTTFLRFTHDVEFFLPIDQPVIHFRSSSRIGIWDLGRNHRRMVRLGERWLEEQPKQKAPGFKFPAPPDGT
ncbi:MAG: DUF1499 domain-containing protein [Elusimicrobia bacterium]|nr:DUF1499 domain-containing protein [Elusimicrobiota bacterium]